MRQKFSASLSRKVRGRRIPAKEQASDLDLHKLREDLQNCPGGF
jgi:hypothetical protein